MEGKQWIASYPSPKFVGFGSSFFEVSFQRIDFLLQLSHFWRDLLYAIEGDAQHYVKSFVFKHTITA